jgi:hypothetical protein
MLVKWDQGSASLSSSTNVTLATAATYGFAESRNLETFFSTPRPNATKWSTEILLPHREQRNKRLMSITNAIMPRTLKNLHIVFMGDSVSRYQYLSLAYYLRSGTWWDPATHPNLVNEKTYGSWTDFYRRTSEEYAPYEQCDCFRPEPFNPTLTFENRYFWDPRFHNSLTYIQAFGNHGSQGHFFPDEVLLHHPAVLSTDSPLKSKLDFWKWDWPETITQHVAKLQPKPDFVVLNAGLHVNDHQNPLLQNAIVSALKTAGITGIWKTTTYMKNKDVHGTRYTPKSKQIDQDMCKLMSQCLDLSWTKHLNATSYWDAFHFNEPAYKRMNMQLLDLIPLLNREHALTTDNATELYGAIPPTTPPAAPAPLATAPILPRHDQAAAAPPALTSCRCDAESAYDDAVCVLNRLSRTEANELHGEHHPPVAIRFGAEPLVAGGQGRMELRFHVVGALIGFKYRIVLQEVDIPMHRVIQQQEIRFSPIDDSASNEITAELVESDSTKTDRIKFSIGVWDAQAGLSEYEALLARKDSTFPRPNSEVLILISQLCSDLI